VSLAVGKFEGIRVDVAIFEYVRLCGNEDVPVSLPFNVRPRGASSTYSDS
jgi:hypothetical protein